jgi:hypothetical protein
LIKFSGCGWIFLKTEVVVKWKTKNTKMSEKFKNRRKRLNQYH